MYLFGLMYPMGSVAPVSIAFSSSTAFSLLLFAIVVVFVFFVESFDKVLLAELLSAHDNVVATIPSARYFIVVIVVFVLVNDTKMAAHTAVKKVRSGY